MKSIFKLASASLLILSGAAFAAPQAATHPATAATHAAPATLAKSDATAGKKQIRAEEKHELAACKSMKGAEKTTCRKDAKAKAASAMAHLKDTSHG